MYRYLLFVIFFTFLLSDYGGGYAGAGFRYGSNARDISLAGSNSTVGSNGFLSFSNPANLVKVANLQLATSYFDLSLDRSIQVLSISKHLPPKAGIGISLFRSGTNNIQGRDLMNEETANFKVSDSFAMLSFGLSPIKFVSLGLNFKIQFSAINLVEEIYKANGISFDLGIVANPISFLKVGAKIENVSGDINWKIDNGDEARTYLELYPKLGSFSMAIELPLSFILFLQQDFVKPISSDLNFRTRIGLEYNGDLLDIRFGMLQKRGEKYNIEVLSNNWSFASGFGFKFASNYSIDYGIGFGHYSEGFGHIISLLYEIE